jgi:hypothetical protein
MAATLFDCEPLRPQALPFVSSFNGITRIMISYMTNLVTNDGKNSLSSIISIKPL